jgi:hypothetical protein
MRGKAESLVRHALDLLPGDCVAVIRDLQKDVLQRGCQLSREIAGYGAFLLALRLPMRNRAAHLETPAVLIPLLRARAQ